MSSIYNDVSKVRTAFHATHLRLQRLYPSLRLLLRCLQRRYLVHALEQLRILLPQSRDLRLKLTRLCDLDGLVLRTESVS